MDDGIPMTTRITKSDLALLKDLADFRLLTLSQIATVHFSSKRSARRRMQQLVESGYAESLPVKGGAGPGRPESVFTLEMSGYSSLKSEGILSATVAFEQVSGRPLLPQAGHQFVLNQCRLHLRHLPTALPRVNTQVLSCNSPFALDPDSGYPLVRDAVSESDETGPTWFAPDAAMAIADRPQDGTFLYYLNAYLIPRDFLPIWDRDTARSGSRSRMVPEDSILARATPYFDGR